MFYTEDYIRKLLDHALTRVSLPENSGIIFEGSIAEGFGNASSDIDFLIITDKEEKRPLLPLIIFYDGRRIEVRYRSAEILTEQAEYFSSFLKKPNMIGQILEDTLDRYQRFLNSLILHNKSVIDPIKKIISYHDYGKILSKWFEIRAKDRIRYSIALMGLGQSNVARNWAQAGLIEAAKSWVASKGELYIFRKWIFHQMERVGADKEMINHFKSLYLNSNNQLRDEEYIEESINMVKQFGIKDCSGDYSQISIKRRKNVTTWLLGDQVHVVRDKKDVFLLKGKVGRIWKNVLFEVPLSEVFSYINKNLDVNVDNKFISDVITKLQKMKLVDFVWQEKKRIIIGNEYNIPPITTLPLLSFDGIVCSEEKDDFIMAPISAEQFAYSGITLVYTNIIIENILEDFYGALENEQWSTCEERLRVMIRQICFLVLCAFGVTPPPPLRNIMDDAIYTLVNLPGINPSIISEVMQIEPIRINNKDDAKLIFEKIEKFLKTVRSLVSANLFPYCFGSEDEWQRALDLAYDWVRMGSYVVSKFPVEEARDLLSTGGQQPHLINKK